MSRLKSIPYIPCPPAYSGTVGEFFDKFCRPNLIPVKEMMKIHVALCTYADDPTAILFLREVRGLDRQREVGGVRQSIEVGRRLIAGTDNSPAWVLHSIARSSLTLEGTAFDAWMKENLPCHMFSIKKVIDNTMNDGNWHAAHIVDAKDGNTAYQSWDADEVRRRFLRSVHPLNIALAPKEKGKNLIGSDKGFLGFYVCQIRNLYGSLWSEFVSELRQPFDEWEGWAESHPLIFDCSQKDQAKVPNQKAIVSWDGPIKADAPKPQAIDSRSLGESFGLSGIPKILPLGDDRVVAWRATRLHFKAPALDTLLQDPSLSGMMIVIDPSEASAGRGYSSGHYYFSREDGIRFMKEKESTKVWLSEGWHAPSPPDKYARWFHPRVNQATS